MHSIFKDIQLHGATEHFFVDTYGAWDNLHMLSKMTELKIVEFSAKKQQQHIKRPYFSTSSDLSLVFECLLIQGLQKHSATTMPLG